MPAAPAADYRARRNRHCWRKTASGRRHYNYFRDYEPATGRYVESDPIGLAGGVNTYSYVGARPMRAIDPSGLETTIVINANTSAAPWTWQGTHVGLHLDSGQFGEPILYDPNGSYDPNGNRGSGGAFSDSDADLSPYLAFQRTDGPNVYSISFQTTPEEEAEIAKRIEQFGESRTFSCATNVSERLSGVGPFKNLGTYRTPNGLAAALLDLARKPGRLQNRGRRY